MEQRFFLGEIFKMLSKRKSQIIIFSFIGLMLAGLYTFFFVSPTYESTSKIVVNQQQNTNQTITSTDIQTNLSLINTYQSIIKEPIILEEVIRQTKSDLTVEQLRGMIAVSTEANSLVFGITINREIHISPQNWQMRLPRHSNKKLVKFWKSHPSLFYQRLLQVKSRFLQILQ